MAAELVSKKQVDANLMDRPSDFPNAEDVRRVSTAGRMDAVAGSIAAVDRPTPAPKSEQVMAFKFTYKCKHCGKEWSKVSTQDVQVPREYVEGEEEKTELDASREAEDAREQSRWRR